MREVEIVIIGGGPAGLAAATEAAESGAGVVLIDEYRTLGGQYYKQVPPDFSVKNLKTQGDQYAEGAEVIRKLKSTGVEVMLDTLVWCIYPHLTLAVYHDDMTEEIRAKKLILAPGAQEVPVAFPGWTLPGVMMGGAAQHLLVSQRLLPGQKVVMAGVGPLQLKVASQLLDAGADVLDILEASSKPPVSMENALRSFGHWGKMRDGLDYWLKLKKARVPYHHQHIPVRALGKEELEAVVVAQVDEDWRVVAGTERTIEADTLCLSYGFIPSSQLTRLARCDQSYNALAGGWVTRHDDNQETSIDGIYVAGEVGGIGGADVASEEGRIAAIAALRALGRVGSEGRRKEEQTARKRLASARKFAQVTGEMMALKPGLFDLITSDTLICRCEDVTAGRIREAIGADGDLTVRGAKVRTRAGMGSCQGRMCGYLVGRMIAKQAGLPVEAIKLDTPQAPVKPVPLRAMVNYSGDIPRG